MKAGCSANYDIVSTELLNTPQIALLEVTWLSHLSFLYESYRFTMFLKILIFYPFPSQMHCLHFYAFDTEASKIMHLIEFKHLKTLKADWQAISASYSGKLEDTHQEPTNSLNRGI